MRRGELTVGLLASAGAVAFVTAAVAVLKPYVPVLSLGVLYEFAVLPVAVLWGLWLATAVSIASMLAFNWFFLPPTHTFALSDTANWAALAVYLVTGVVVSVLATQARRRAELAAEEALEAEALRRSDTMKTAVLHSVSHDLRSPLTAIVAAASGLATPEVRWRAPTGTSSSRPSAQRPIGSTAWSATCSTSRGSRAESPPRMQSYGRQTISSTAPSISSVPAASAS